MKPDRSPDSPDDARLRTRFVELRKNEERGAPEFRAMWTAPRPARSPWRVLAPAASLAAAAMFFLWCGAHMTLESASAPQAAAPAIQAPGAAPLMTAAAPPAAGGGAGTMPAAVAGEAMFDATPLDFLLDVPGSAPRSVQASFDANPLQGW